MNMTMYKLIKITKFLNTLFIFKSKKITYNFFFLIRYIFFSRKKIERHLKDSYKKIILKTKDGKSVELYQSNFEMLSDDFLLNSEEIRLNDKIKNFFPNIDFIFDIGANIGSWTIAQRTLHNKDTKIYSFEPIKKTFEVLKKNIPENSNIKIYNFALGEEDTYQTMSLPIEALKEGGYYKTGTYTLKTRSLFFNEKVQVFKFDTIFEKNFKNIINPKNSGVFIKVDIEGNELEFLKGAINTLKILDNLLIQIEFNKKCFFFSKENYISNFEKRLDIIKSLGFKKVFYETYKNHVFQSIDINDLNLQHLFENVYVINILFLK